MAFVLDGSNNLLARCWIGNTVYATIAAAMAAASGGDTIHLSEGVFAEDVTFSQAGLTLVGAGVDKTTISGEIDVDSKDYSIMHDFTVYDVAPSSGYLIRELGNECEIRDVRPHSVGGTAVGIYTAAPGTPINGLQFENIFFQGCLRGLELDATSEDIYGVSLRNIHGSDIQTNLIKLIGNTSYGVYYHGKDIRGTYCQGDTVSIVGCYGILDGVLSLESGGSGVYVEEASQTHGSMELINSTLTRNDYGLYLKITTVANYQFRNNNIQENVTNDAYTFTSGVTADVEYNWWGLATPAGGQFGVGGGATMDYTPWLTMPTSSLYNSTLLQSTGGTTPAAVWGHVTRTLTAETLGSGQLAKQSDVTGLNDVSSADVETACDASVAKVATNTTNKLTDARALALDSISTILTDTNEIQGKLPTNYLMGSSDVDDHDTDIDAILVDTGTTIPNTLSLLDTAIGNVDGVVNDVLLDTANIDGKMPTNYVMGSSDTDDHDTDIDAILVDTGTTLPATLTTIEGKVDTVDGIVDTILVDTADMQPKVDSINGKMPTNYVMGSSDQTDKDDDIDAILVDTGTTIPAQLVTMESDIRGADSDTLKTLSDQIDNVEPEAQVDITINEPLIIPYGATTLDGAVLASCATMDVDNAAVFEADGYIAIDSGGNLEYKHYSSISGNTITLDAHGLFGTSDVGHADGVAVKQIIPQRTKLTIHDAGVPKAPDSAPTLAIVDMEGNSILAATSMTQEGSKVGIYYYDIIVTAGDVPDVREYQYVVVVDTNTNEYRRLVATIDKPATTGEVFSESTGGLYYCNQDGYLNSSGVWTAWTDDEVGDFTDDSGNAIFGGRILWYLKVSGTTQKQLNPPGNTTTDINGRWILQMPVGTYEVQFWKDGVVFPTPVERTVA